MTLQKRLALVAALTLAACGPAAEPEVPELEETSAALGTCTYSVAESYVSQEEACQMARERIPQACAHLGGVASSSRLCTMSAYATPYVGSYRVCCNQ